MTIMKFNSTIRVVLGILLISITWACGSAAHASPQPFDDSRDLCDENAIVDVLANDFSVAGNELTVTLGTSDCPVAITDLGGGLFDVTGALGSDSSCTFTYSVSDGGPAVNASVFLNAGSNCQPTTGAPAPLDERRIEALHAWNDHLALAPGPVGSPPRRELADPHNRPEVEDYHWQKILVLLALHELGVLDDSAVETARQVMRDHFVRFPHDDTRYTFFDLGVRNTVMRVYQLYRDILFPPGDDANEDLWTVFHGFVISVAWNDPHTCPVTCDPDVSCGHTENHMALYNSFKLLSKQVHGVPLSNPTYVATRDWWVEFLQHGISDGFQEWASSGDYESWTWSAILNLADFADDQNVRKLAQVALDYSLALQAGQSAPGGVFASGGVRAYPYEILGDYRQLRTHIAQILFTGGDLSEHDGGIHGPVEFAVSNYRPLSLVAEVFETGLAPGETARTRQRGKFRGCNSPWFHHTYRGSTFVVGTNVTPVQLENGYYHPHDTVIAYISSTASPTSHVVPIGYSPSDCCDTDSRDDRHDATKFSERGFGHQNVAIYTQGGKIGGTEYPPRLYVSSDFTIKHPEDNWFFLSNGETYVAWQTTSGRPLDDPTPPPRQGAGYFLKSRVTGITAAGETAVLEVGDSELFGSFAAFKESVKTRVPDFDGVNYETRDGTTLKYLPGSPYRYQIGDNPASAFTPSESNWPRADTEHLDGTLLSVGSSTLTFDYLDGDGDGDFLEGADSRIPASVTFGSGAPPPLDPLTVTGPGDAEVDPGGTVTLAISVQGGAPPYSFAWEFSPPSPPGPFAPITGSEYEVLPSGSLQLVNAQEIHEGSYRVVVTDAVGLPVDSAVAYLTVTGVGPLSLSDPLDASAFLGESASFVVTASGGTETYNFQWEYSASGDPASFAPVSGSAFDITTPIPGQSRLTIDPLVLDHGGWYRAVVDDGAASLASQAALLTVSVMTEPGVVGEDSFSNDGPGRSPGEPLSGVMAEAGGRVWIADPSVVFGAGHVTAAGNGQTSSQHTGSLVFDPADYADTPVAMLEADVVVAGLGSTQWAGLGFWNDDATGGHGAGVVWMFLRRTGRVSVLANGTTVTLLGEENCLSVEGCEFFPTGSNHLALELDTQNRTVSAWLNGTALLAAAPLPDISDEDYVDLDQIEHASFDLYLAAETPLGGAYVDSFRLSVDTDSAADPLEITTHPVDAQAPIDGTASFSVAASGGTGDYAFDWQHSASPTGTFESVAGGTGYSITDTPPTSTLVASPVASQHVGWYRVVVREGAGSVTSSPVSLTLSSTLFARADPDPNNDPTRLTFTDHHESYDFLNSWLLENDDPSPTMDPTEICTVSDLSHGTLELRTCSAFPCYRYTPPAGFPGGDVTFAYTMSDTIDGNGQCVTQSNEALVTLTLPEPPDPPVASFDSSCSGLTCDFDANTSTGEGLSYAWQFGDGSSGVGQTMSHSYSALDGYFVELEVTDSFERTDSEVHFVQPVLAGADPVTGLWWVMTMTEIDPPKLTIDSGTQLLANDSGPEALYIDDVVTWPSRGTLIPHRDTATEPILAFDYAPEGCDDVTDSFSYRLLSDAAATSSDVGLVTIVIVPGDPPVAAFEFSCVDLTCDFANLSQASNDQETVIWDFGDGEGSSREHHPQYTYGSTGPFEVTLTVVDRCGQEGTASQSVSLTYTETDPLQVTGASPALATVDVGEAISLAVVASGGSSSVSYQWEFSPTGPDTGFQDLVESAEMLGVDTETLSLSHTQIAQAGWYRCRVTDLVTGESALSGVSRVEVLGANLASDPGMEDPAEWTEVWSASSYPGTGIVRDDGLGAPHSGQSAYGISNLATGSLVSEALRIDEGVALDLHAWVRGEVDAEGSSSSWSIRLNCFNGNDEPIGTRIAASGGSGPVGATSNAWVRHGDTVETCPGTATVTVDLGVEAASGWIAFDDVTLVVAGTVDNLLPDGGLENEGSWTESPAPGHPATGFRWGGGIGQAHSGAKAVAIHNLAFTELVSDPIAVEGGQSYDFGVWLRSEIDPDDSRGTSVWWSLWLHYYDGNGSSLGKVNVDQGGTALSWIQRGAQVEAPVNAASARVKIRLKQASGWLNVDDVSLVKVGTGTNLVANAGFEAPGGWTRTQVAGFPASGGYRNNWGIARPRTGSYGHSLHNLAFGRLLSAPFAVTPETSYELSSMARGEVDPDDSEWGWGLRAQFYDEAGALLGFVFAEGPTVNPIGPQPGMWTELIGRIESPAGASTARIDLLVLDASGWVAFDEVSMKEVH